jgi:hypothetical protein
MGGSNRAAAALRLGAFEVLEARLTVGFCVLLGLTLLASNPPRPPELPEEEPLDEELLDELLLLAHPRMLPNSPQGTVVVVVVVGVGAEPDPLFELPAPLELVPFVVGAGVLEALPRLPI